MQLASRMTVLVTGGAGYIGSHLVRRLRAAGRSVVVVDDLSSGHRDAVPADVPIVVADVGDSRTIAHALRRYGVRAVVHFAARIEVGESVTNPRLYWMQNVVGTAKLLEAMLDGGLRTFVLSSTAAVYGIPRAVPVTELEPTLPINPYGETKLAIEKMLATYASAYGLRYAALRYFNAAGADEGLAERHEPETHVIPRVLDVALGLSDSVTIFGRDYPTADGTCVRDYVHVADLADAHLAALEYLERGGESGPFNLGTGSGHSVAEVISACRAVTGHRIPVVNGPRRDGDPAVLVACPLRAQACLGWRARRSSLERIVRDAWAAHLLHHARSDARRARRPEEHAHVR